MEFNEQARYELINFLIKKYNFIDYLEIGYQQGINYNKINIKNKMAVDPSPMIQNPSIDNLNIVNDVYIVKSINLYITTSDLFFEKFDKKFDIIFIDGLHTYEQVKRDFENSIKSLNEDGVIVLHDMNPDDVFYNGGIITGEERSKSFSDGGQWNGDCYKMAIDMFNGDYNYEYITLNIDNGCMVVFPYKNRETLKGTVSRNYSSLSGDRENILKLKSTIDFIKIMDSK